MKITTFLSTLIMANSLHSATRKPPEPQVLLPQYAVNMQDGGLILKEQRGAVPIREWEWVYRSRSLHKGYFGQGWCSEIEMELRFKSKGELQLWTCHQARTLIFKLSATSAAYVNTEDPDDHIKIRLGHYSRFKGQKSMAEFNRRGQPTAILIHGTLWSLNYDQRQLPASMTNQSGGNLSFKWHPILSSVTSLQLDPRSKIDFHYEGFNLTRTITYNGVRALTHKYDYDDLDNLILWQGVQSTIRFDYQKDKDQIRRIHSHCREEYEFAHESAKKRVGLMKKTCPDGKGLTTRFEFNYESPSSRLPAQVHIEKVDESMKVAQRRSL